MGSGRRPRILFISEAVTLAHIVRPIALAQDLDPARYEVVLASDPRYRALLGHLAIPLRAIRTIPSECFLEALVRGRPLYDAETLRGYVREDLEVIEETSPDLIVGDFRLSLAVRRGWLVSPTCRSPTFTGALTPGCGSRCPNYP